MHKIYVSISSNKLSYVKCQFPTFSMKSRPPRPSSQKYVLLKAVLDYINIGFSQNILHNSWEWFSSFESMKAARMRRGTRQ